MSAVRLEFGLYPLKLHPCYMTGVDVSCHLCVSPYQEKTIHQEIDFEQVLINGRFSGSIKGELLIFGTYNHRKVAFY